MHTTWRAISISSRRRAGEQALERALLNPQHLDDGWASRTASYKAVQLSHGKAVSPLRLGSVCRASTVWRDEHPVRVTTKECSQMCLFGSLSALMSVELKHLSANTCSSIEGSNVRGVSSTDSLICCRHWTQRGPVAWLLNTQLCPLIWALILALLAMLVYKVLRRCASTYICLP